MPDDHSYRKNPSVADLMRKRAAEEAVREADHAAREVALGVVERWNAERSPLWSPTIRCARDRRNAVARRLLSRVPHKPGD